MKDPRAVKRNIDRKEPIQQFHQTFLMSTERFISLTIKKRNGLLKLIKGKHLWSEEFNVSQMHRKEMIHGEKNESTSEEY